MNKGQMKYYTGKMKLIRKHLGIQYTGTTDDELVAFVKTHINELPTQKDPKTPLNKRQRKKKEEEKKFFRYSRLAGRIERELEIRYEGRTDKDLQAFVDIYSPKLQNKNT